MEFKNQKAAKEWLTAQCEEHATKHGKTAYGIIVLDTNFNEVVEDAITTSEAEFKSLAKDWREDYDKDCGYKVIKVTVIV